MLRAGLGAIIQLVNTPLFKAKSIPTKDISHDGKPHSLMKPPKNAEENTILPWEFLMLSETLLSDIDTTLSVLTFL